MRGRPKSPIPNMAPIYDDAYLEAVGDAAAKAFAEYAAEPRDRGWTCVACGYRAELFREETCPRCGTHQYYRYGPDYTGEGS